MPCLSHISHHQMFTTDIHVPRPIIRSEPKSTMPNTIHYPNLSTNSTFSCEERLNCTVKWSENNPHLTYELFSLQIKQQHSISLTLSSAQQSSHKVYNHKVTQRNMHKVVLPTLILPLHLYQPPESLTPWPVLQAQQHTFITTSNQSMR